MGLGEDRTGSDVPVGQGQTPTCGPLDLTLTPLGVRGRTRPHCCPQPLTRGLVLSPFCPPSARERQQHPRPLVLPLPLQGDDSHPTLEVAHQHSPPPSLPPLLCGPQRPGGSQRWSGRSGVGDLGVPALGWETWGSRRWGGRPGGPAIASLALPEPPPGLVSPFPVDPASSETKAKNAEGPPGPATAAGRAPAITTGESGSWRAARKCPYGCLVGVWAAGRAGSPGNRPLPGKPTGKQGHPQTPARPCTCERGGGGQREPHSEVGKRRLSGE